MRLAGTALVCVIASFGAAFLVARAVIHQPAAKAATTQAVLPAAPQVTAVTKNHNRELVAQFAPMRAALKAKPKPHRTVHHVAPVVVAPSTSSTPAAPTDTQPQYNPAPVYTPAPAPAPTPTHKRSSSNSGTTTIG